MRATVHTECACCGRVIELRVDDQLDTRVLTPGAAPLLVLPVVNIRRLTDPTIIDAL